MVKRAAEETDAKISSSYDAAQTAFENDVLKRGLARSSIAVNKTAELTSGKAAALAESAAAAEGAIAAIDKEIAQLEVSRQNALNSYNIKYAAQLTEKINQLTSERDEKVAEVTKYNNSLTEKEQNAAVDKIETESDLYTELLNQMIKEQQIEQNSDAAKEKASAQFEEMKMESKYNAIREFLSGYSPEKASALVRSYAVIREQLSDYYYYKLYNEFVAA